jgi:hypothetical protein
MFPLITKLREMEMRRIEIVEEQRPSPRGSVPPADDQRPRQPDPRCASRTILLSPQRPRR